MKIKKKIINDCFEVFGYWSLDKNMTEKHSGILIKNDEDITLKIFTENLEWNHDKIDFIYGNVESGEVISLRKLIEVKGFGVRNITTFTFLVQEIYIGSFIDNETIFKSITFGFDFLNNWINKGIKLTSRIQEEEFNNYPKDKYIITDNIVLSDGLIGNEKVRRNSYMVNINKNLKLSFNNSINLDETLYNFFKINLFLNVLINKSIVFNYIKLKTNNDETIYRIFNQEKDKNFHDNLNVPFYEKVKDTLELSLQCWFENFPLFYTLTSELIKPNFYRYDVKAFHVEKIRSFEIYHREFLEKKTEQESKQDLEEDKKILEEIICNRIKNVEYFMKRINYEEGTYSFRKRLELTFKNLPELYKQQLSNHVNKTKGRKKSPSDNISSFSNKLVKDRNDFIHNNVIDEKNILNHDKYLFEEAKLLQRFLRYFVLKELGFKDEILLRNDYYY
ncbi:TPA: HEPN domain-containing protein [Staphylococcus aureus]